MKRWIIIGIVLWVAGIAELPAIACTLWAANGSAVDGGGSLIVKNRDWIPDHEQILKLVAPENGYKYIGLYAVNGRSPGLKEGLNERGLVVVSATAGSIPSKERRAMPHTRGLISKLLRNCSSVEEALAQTELFVGPQILTIADKYKVATIEIGPEGKFSIDVKENGAIFHTNHYIANSLQEFNQIYGSSSHARYDRIAALLNNTAIPYNLDTFIEFSKDQNDGPDNSIFRTGSTPHKTRTMAVWAVSIPQNDPAELYVRILNPGETEKVYRLNTADVFAGKTPLD